MSIWDEDSESDDFQHADFYDRYLAMRIDGVVQAIVFFFLVFISFYFLFDMIHPILLIFSVIILGEFFYFSILEYIGNTLGKKFAGIKVVDTSGDRITLKQSLVRNSERLIWLIPLLGQILLYLSVDNIKTYHCRFGDDWANTYVIDESPYWHG